MALWIIIDGGDTMEGNIIHFQDTFFTLRDTENPIPEIEAFCKHQGMHVEFQERD